MCHIAYVRYGYPRERELDDRLKMGEKEAEPLRCKNELNWWGLGIQRD